MHGLSMFLLKLAMFIALSTHDFSRGECKRRVIMARKSFQRKEELLAGGGEE